MPALSRAGREARTYRRASATTVLHGAGLRCPQHLHGGELGACDSGAPVREKWPASTPDPDPDVRGQRRVGRQDQDARLVPPCQPAEESGQVTFGDRIAPVPAAARRVPAPPPGRAGLDRAGADGPAERTLVSVTAQALNSGCGESGSTASLVTALIARPSPNMSLQWNGAKRFSGADPIGHHRG